MMRQHGLMGVGVPPTPVGMQKAAGIFSSKPKTEFGKADVADMPKTMRFANRNWVLRGDGQALPNKGEWISLAMTEPTSSGGLFSRPKRSRKQYGTYLLAEGQKPTLHNWQDEARKLLNKGIPGDQVREMLTKRAGRKPSLQQRQKASLRRMEQGRARRNKADPERQKRIREMGRNSTIEMPYGQAPGGNPDFVSGVQYGGKAWAPSREGKGRYMTIDHFYHDGVEPNMKAYSPFYEGEKIAAFGEDGDLLGLGREGSSYHDVLEKEAAFTFANMMAPLRWGTSLAMGVGKPLMRAGAGAARGVLGPMAGGAFRTAGRVARAPFRYVANAPKGQRLNRAMRVAVPSFVAYDVANQGQRWARAGTYGDPEKLRRLGKPLMGAGSAPRRPVAGFSGPARAP